ncbi:MAG: hypothetical protein RIM99_10805 [Cyclobacteriaceae bacterium]
MILNISIALSIFLFTSYCSPSGDFVDFELKYADVQGVKVSGDEGSYAFSVTISSPDKGCSQYADWWEVVSESGELIYRRILAHSHVSEQPFTRSGGKISVLKNQKVWVRAHMNNAGYGGIVMKGNVTDGFAVDTMPDDFAMNLETEKPLPGSCAF